MWNFLDDDYGINKLDGKISRLRETKDKFDRLIALDENGKETDKSIIVSDKNILPNLWNDGKDAADYGGNYAVTNNKRDAFEVFKFAAENSIVEWGIQGYRTITGQNEYFVGTSHNTEYVNSSHTMNRFQESNMIFDMHSHQNTKGASYETHISNDMGYIRNRYNRFETYGMKNVFTWFNANGVSTVFPNHYIYHAPTHILYHYTPWKPNIYIRNVNNTMGLYYNLGF
jgi:hypothetical protein